MDHNEAADAGDWVRQVGRLRFGTQTVGGKKISGLIIKAVADRLAWYGDPDGSNVRPGIARLAVDLETTQTTVKNAIAVLRRVGLLRLVKPGGRNRGADVYQLIIGVDIIEQPDITFWTLGQHTMAVKHQSDKYAGRSATQESQTPQGSAIEAGSRTPQGSAVDQIADLIADPVGSGKAAIADPVGSGSQTPEGSATAHDRVSNTTAHPDEDHRTKLTLSRARPPEDPQNFLPVDEPTVDPRAAARAIAADAARTHGPRGRASPDPAAGPVRRAITAVDNALADLGLATPTWTEKPA